jgi:ferric-dicitrate binding protein FerR (iron transport regulator)
MSGGDRSAAAGRDGGPADPGQAGDRGVVELLRAAGPRPTAPPEVAAEVRAAVRAHWLRAAPARRPRAARWGWLGLTAAAALAVALGFGWRSGWGRSAVETAGPAPTAAAETVAVRGAAWDEGAGRAGRRPLAPGARLPAGSRLATGRRGHAALRLAAGGPTVRLDGASRIELTSAEAVTLLAGALYVDSGGGPARRGVEVRAGRDRVRELGTRFEVRLLAAALRVRVREGAVEVERSGATWRADAGDELSIDAGGGVARRPVLPYGEAWSWVLDAAPPFASDGKTLEELLGWIGRETGREIHYADPRLRARMARETLHGDLGWTRPDLLADAVLPAFGLEARVTGARLIVEER